MSGKTELVWITSMGRRMRVSMTPKDAAGWRRKAAKARALKAAATRKARAALQGYSCGGETLEAAIAAVSRRARFCDSHERLFIMLQHIYHAPREVFWPVFLDMWDVCDATWDVQDLLLGALREHAPAILSDEERGIFDTLPDPVRVFRGCSRERVEGVSWTTERRVAEGFAHGHRFIPVPDPVVATAMIAKDSIFLANNERNEHEVLLDPDGLQGLSVETWKPEERP